MISFVILLSCFLLRAQSLEDYCFALGGDCEYDFLCLFDGDGVCDVDQNAEVSYDPNFSCTNTGKTDCVDGTYSYYNGAATLTVYYTISNIKSFSDIDACSIEYTISNDLDGSPYCDTTNCGIVNYGKDVAGADINACFDYCWANPADAACSGEPCKSGKVCCANIGSTTCTTYCTENGTVENCCGGPATYSTVNTLACQAYVGRYPSSYTQSYQNCLNVPTNLTACGLCKTYTSCCSLYKNDNPVVAASICDDFCALKPADADCDKRKKCLDSLGHEPTAAELAKCGTSMVRLSSFTVAVLLGVMAFFFLV